MEIGKLDDGLYRLMQSSPSFQSHATTCQSTSMNAPLLSENVPCKYHSPLVIDSISCSHCTYHSELNKMELLWHNRVGHIPFVRMREIPHIPCKFSTKQPFTCTVCPLARQPRLPFRDSSIKTTNAFQLIHVDTWGPYGSPTHNGCKYFLTIVDDFTGATWTHLMGSKSNVFPLIKAFIAMIKT